MARRPNYKHRDNSHGIKCGKIAPWPKDVASPEEIAARVTYKGNPKHKSYPSCAGPPAQRADAAKCDQFAEEHWPNVLKVLRKAICNGYVSEFRGEFPYRAWAWINNVLHEARLTNKITGEYHGFPINDIVQYPDPKDRLSEAPRVEIPVVRK